MDLQVIMLHHYIIWFDGSGFGWYSSNKNNVGNGYEYDYIPLTYRTLDDATGSQPPAA